MVTFHLNSAKIIAEFFFVNLAPQKNPSIIVAKFEPIVSKSFPKTPAPINEIKMFPNILTGDRVPSDDELDPETILSNLKK